jgi:FkbM family methyltransferase
MIKSIVRKIPKSWIRWLGRLQFKIPLLAPLIKAAGMLTTKGVASIASGVGEGLLFDNCGGKPGYSLGTSEPEEQEALAREVQDGMCVYNAGANIGFHAVILARLVGPSGFVVCFEPFEESAKRCADNLALNAFAERSEVIQKAVSDSDGTTELVLRGGNDNFSIIKGKREEDSACETLTISTCSLDSFVLVEHRRPPDVITLDIEGAEVAALCGARAVIKAFKPIIFVELHWLQPDFTKYFAAELAPLGYEAFTLSAEVYQFDSPICREHVVLKIP